MAKDGKTDREMPRVRTDGREETGKKEGWWVKEQKTDRAGEEGSKIWIRM